MDFKSELMITNITTNEAAALMGFPNFSNKVTSVTALATPERDAKVLYRIVATITPEFILEIGTYYGHTTYGFKLNSPKSIIYTIDICKEMGIKVPQYQEIETLQHDEVGIIFKDNESNIVQVFGDSRKISTYRDLPDFDFVYIDGNHSCESIISDTKNVFDKTKQNAIILWHDYKDDGFVETKIALNEIIKRFKIRIFHIKETWLAFTINNDICGFRTEQQNSADTKSRRNFVQC